MPLHLSDSPDSSPALPEDASAEASAGRCFEGKWQADPGYGVYVHVPFCRHRCHYCDFNTYEGLDALHRPYVDALEREIGDARHDGRSATSVFFGGGTPTLLAPDALARLLRAVRDSIGVATGAEVTIEANPETVDEATFAALLDAGFNRFSLGVQSLARHVLGRLGRTHSAETALDAIAAAHRAGATDVNADLIYGSPWESAEDWRRSLDGIVAAGTAHVSAYALTVEEGTPLATLVATGREPDMDPDVQADRHGIASDILGGAGFARYEVSNWSKPGRASRHNVLYWSAGDYAGFGAGAHGHESGRRYWRKRLPREYVEDVGRGASTEAGSEQLTPEQRAREAMTLGLRLVSGVDESAFCDRFPAARSEIDATAGALCAEGWLVREDGWLRVSSAGTFVANDILCRFL